jgi:diguanylate cyclase (GGDEF)-like protein/PAS domain S-box-containing protein
MPTPAKQPLADTVEQLQRQVDDLHSALQAITTGEVDALLMESGTDQPGEATRIYTRATADQPYRLIVEQMGEGAATISSGGLVLYANQRLAELTARERLSILGNPLADLVVAADQQVLEALLQVAPGCTEHAPLSLLHPDGSSLPVLAAMSGLESEGVRIHCLVVADLSRIRETEQALFKSEHRYRLLAENASALAIETNDQQRITWVTSSIQTVLGWQVNEMIDAAITDLVHPEDTFTLHEEARPTQVRLRSKDGGFHWMQELSWPLPAPPEGSGGWISSFQDVDTLVLQRRVLEKERARLAATLDSLLDPHVVLEAVRDSQGEIIDFIYTDANESACTEIGRDHNQLVGHHLLEAMPPQLGTALFSMYRQTVQTKEPLVLNDFVYPYQLKAEDRRYDVRAVAVSDSISYTWRDVTERRLTRLRLEASEEKFRLLAENSSDVVIQSRQGQLVWVSPSVQASLGWTPTDWLGRRLEALVHAADLEIFHGITPALAAGAEAVVVRFRLRARDLSYHWVEMHAKSYIKSNGERDGEVASFRTVDSEVSKEQLLEQRARSDELTGLANRKEVLEHLDQLLQFNRCGDRLLALAFCDIDHLKDINDSQGHQAGDLVLRAAAERISGSVRRDDVVARFGGDELLVVLHGVENLAQAMAVAEKIRVAFQLPVSLADGKDPITMTISIGVTLAQPEDSVATLINRADQALYQAKSEGRNRVVPIPPPALEGS